MGELICEHVSKRYGAVWALRDFSMQAGPGVIGLVGPNGAGKTTLLRLIATVLPQSEGKICWNGQDVRSDGATLRRTLGYLPQRFTCYPNFSARAFLLYMATMKGLPHHLARRRVNEVLEMVNLEQEADRKLATYSGGMKQRVGIAQMLLNDPEVLLVDEPTASLAPEERIRFRTLLATLTRDRLVLFSTHVIDDLESFARHVMLLQEGRLLADAPLATFVQQARGKVWSLTVDAEALSNVRTRYPLASMRREETGITLRLLSETRPAEQAEAVEPTLEEAYLLVTRSNISGV